MNTDTNQTFTAAPDPFGLARLPQPEPPVDGWPPIAAALQRHHMARRWAVLMATAAILISVIGIYWQLPARQMAAELVRPAAVASPAGKAVSPVGKDNLESLVGLSQELERNLRLMRAEIGVVPAQSLIYQIELEDMVSQLDEAINLQPASRELWVQRVNLLLDLSQLYQQQLRRDYAQIASL